ncbi:MAG: diacylglycerol/lipid kinase family protein [Gaiellaceae bacterium]
MSEIVFLVNPASANGSTGKRWPEIAREAMSEGLVGDVLFSEHGEHLPKLAREALERGAKRLVVVGGDGSIHQVVNGLGERIGEVELALISRGTGWDYAREFGIPRGVRAAARVALEGDVREVDVGRARCHAWSGEELVTYFVNAGGAGISGAIAQRVDDTSKALGAKASYLWGTVAVFVRWRNCLVQVRVDEEERSGTMHEVLVGIGRYENGGMKLFPEAKPDDGLFDVLLMGDLTKRDLIANVVRLYRGTFLPHPKIELLKGRAVTVDAEQPLPIQLDGEQPGTTPVRFELLPRALRLRVPATSDD